MVLLLLCSCHLAYMTNFATLVLVGKITPFSTQVLLQSKCSHPQWDIIFIQVILFHILVVGSGPGDCNHCQLCFSRQYCIAVFMYLYVSVTVPVPVPAPLPVYQHLHPQVHLHLHLYLYQHIYI